MERDLDGVNIYKSIYMLFEFYEDIEFVFNSIIFVNKLIIIEFF